MEPIAVRPSEFFALVRLTAKDGTVLADVGERCDRVPAVSLPWLIAQHLVTRRDD